MINEVKINKFIGVLGVLVSSFSLAGVDEYCQYLQESVSMYEEPDVCGNLFSEVPKSQSGDISLKAEKIGSSTSTSFIYESRTTDNMSTHPVGDFSTQTVLGTVPGSIRAMAFDEAAGVLYAIENDAKELLTVDQVNGALTTVGSFVNLPATDLLTGIDIAPDGTCYVTSSNAEVNPTASTMFTCDLSTGTLTVVGSQSTSPIIIGIAADCSGNLYGHDIGDDSIYSINTSTGASTLIGPTGLDANFSQDITYDRENHKLLGYFYIGQGSNTYGEIDVCTGAVTALAVDNPLGEYLGASKTDCALSDIIFRGSFDC